MKRAAAFVVALLVPACTSSSQPPSVSHQHSPIVSPTTASLSPTESPSSSPSVSPIPTTSAAFPSVSVVVPLRHAPTRLAESDGVVYALVQLNNGSLVKVVRFDPATGSVTSSAPIHGGDLALTGRSLWVSGGETLAFGKPPSLAMYRLDPSSLQITRRMQLPSTAGDLMASPAGLWVGSDRALYLLDAASGDVLRTVPVRMTVGRLAFDPAHGVLYDSLHTRNDASVRGIEERDARTGSVVVASYDKIGDLNMNALAATPDGVWAAEPTGMLGGASLYSRSDLRPVHGAGVGGTNGILVEYVDGVLWIPDEMTGHLRCADPATGKVRTWIPRPGPKHDGSYDTNVVAIGSTLYVGTLNNGLVRIDPGLSCGALTASWSPT